MRHGTRKLSGERARHGAWRSATGLVLRRRVAGFYSAVDSLEKGYRAWGTDIGPDYTPFEAGLGFAVKLKTDQDFRGRKALMKQQSEGVKRMMTTFTAVPELILSGRETIYRDGVRVGYLSSESFGHHIGKSIGMGYVRNPDGVDRDHVF